MSNIWQDPFGLNLFKSTKTKKCPSSVPDQPKTHYHPMPCPRMPAMQQLIYSEVIYTQITSPTICYQVQPSQSATNCHCNHSKSKKTKTKKPIIDGKKKKELEAQKKKEKERADRDSVVPTFSNPRKPRKGVFER